jgi:membrane protease YdiL (CAAX protease family)
MMAGFFSIAKEGIAVQLNPFWRSVWEVFLFLAGISLLGSIVTILVGWMPLGTNLHLILEGAVVPIAGAMTYLNWRWGWRADTIGLRAKRVPLWLGAGLGLGVISLAAIYLLGALFGDPLPKLNRMDERALISGFAWALVAVAVEIIFRGGVIPRFQADLGAKEAFWAALLAPAVWTYLSGGIFGGIPTGIVPGAFWTPFFSAVLTLLYLRTGSLWLTIGLHVTMGALPVLLGAVLPQTALLYWMAAAIILALLEWSRLKRLPRRMNPHGPRVKRQPW